MEFFTTWYVLPAAFLLDMIIGDPQFAHHPIRYMGKAIVLAEPFFRKLKVRLSVAGALCALCLILGTLGTTWLLMSIAQSIHPLVRNMLEILLIYTCISARSLEAAAREVCHSLEQNDLREAKDKVSLIVGRDVDPLSEKGVAQAALETVAENLVDGVISPLFFAAIGGAPLAMTYKMINTLDSMIGYKNETYKAFGKTAAHIDDGANFIPARLAVPFIAISAQILCGKGMRAFRTAVTEGGNHASPNAGYPEAAFAGALGVRLGGPNYYHGELVHKPFIGADFGSVETRHIPMACDLMLLSAFLCFTILWGIFCF